MIGYVTLGTNDLKRGARFYDALLGEMGVGRLMEMESFIVWSNPGEPGLALTQPFDKQPASVGNGVMVALHAGTTEKVDQLYARAIELGGIDAGPAGPRGPHFYAGYFRDPDGNKLSFFCRT